MPAMNKRSMILGLAVLLGTSACGDSARSSEPVSTTPATTTAPELTDDTTPTTLATTTTGSAYATAAFNLPFDVTLPVWVDATPSVEQPNFVTWESTTVDRALRFLIPVSVYPPGGAGPTSPPTNYLDYLLAQSDHGAHFADQTQTTIGGRPATIVTATVDNSLDGSLGCPDTITSASDCFGLQPDFVLRIAVVDTGAAPLLIWLRGPFGTDMTADNASFAELLTTIRFSDRPVQEPTTTTTVVGVATALDGTYRWTLSAADAMAHGMPGDKTPESQATFPWVFTMSMDNGRWSLVHRQADGDVDDGAGSYTVDGDQVSFDWNADVLTFTFSVDGDGAVHLDPDPAINPGDAFVWATNPWTKIADGTATATVLDGTYRWTLTKDDAVAHGNPTPQELPTFPWVFTMTMDAGTWQLANIDGQGVANSDAGHGSYAVEGDRVVFHEAAEVFSYTFSADPDGTVHLVAQPPINPGTAWVFATNPWTKIN